ncbi:MAG: BMP family lipoprotein [Spirochaetota bacterium]
MKKVLAVMLVAALVCAAGCGKQGEQKQEEKTVKVGIVLSIGGLGDKSFNDAAYRGLEWAKRDFDMEFNYVEPASTAEDEQFLTQYAQSGYDLIIATGFLMKDACEKVAKQYPDTKFAIIDSVIDLPNVSSLTFKEHEGSFLVGALAGLMTESNTIGFVGGMEIPLIKKFEYGYEQGAKYTNPNVKILSLYTTGQNPFNDPVQGKDNALNQIGQGADVVYHAAGGTGLGVIEACKEKGVWAIGVDSNQDGVAKGTVLTSMLKKVDVAVYDTVKSVIEGNFESGVQSFGVKEGGVGTTDFEFTRDKIPAEYLVQLDEIKELIKTGELEVKAQR